MDAMMAKKLHLQRSKQKNRAMPGFYVQKCKSAVMPLQRLPQVPQVPQVPDRST